MSSDGYSWSLKNLPFNASWQRIIYGNGLFLIGSSNSSLILYSSDGINWNSTNVSGTCSNLVYGYGNNKFVATCKSGNYAYYSSDCITWNAGTVPAGSSGGTIGIEYGGGIYVSYGITSSALYSTNGIDWNPTNITINVNTVKYINGKFIAMDYLGDKTFVSTNGITWSAGSMLPRSTSWRTSAYSQTSKIAIALAIGTDTSAITSDGTTWTYQKMPLAGQWTDITFSDKQI